MKFRHLAVAVAFVLSFLGPFAEAQTTPLKDWPTCRLGAAPIAPGPAPADATVYHAVGGPVIMTEAGPKGSVRMIRCVLEPGTPIYRGTDGALRDLPSNQPFWPVGWDSQPPESKVGPIGPAGPVGPPGPKGPAGPAGRDGLDQLPPEKSEGHTVRNFLVGTAVALVIGKFAHDKWLHKEPKVVVPHPGVRTDGASKTPFGP